MEGEKITKLTAAEIERRKYLVEKLKTKVLTPVEADELRQLLEREKQEASEAGNFLVVLGLLLLLGLVIAYLAGDDK